MPPSIYSRLLTLFWEARSPNLLLCSSFPTIWLTGHRCKALSLRSQLNRERERMTETDMHTGQMTSTGSNSLVVSRTSTAGKALVGRMDEVLCAAQHAVEALLGAMPMTITHELPGPRWVTFGFTVQFNYGVVYFQEFRWASFFTTPWGLFLQTGKCAQTGLWGLRRMELGVLLPVPGRFCRTMVRL